MSLRKSYLADSRSCRGRVRMTAPPVKNRKEYTMVETAQREAWIAPDFVEFETPTEVTSYAARVD